MQTKTLAVLLLVIGLIGLYQEAAIYVGCEECWYETDPLDFIFGLAANFLFAAIAVAVWLHRPWARFFVYLIAGFVASTLLHFYLTMLQSGLYRQPVDFYKPTAVTALVIILSVWSCLVAARLKVKMANNSFKADSKPLRGSERP